MSSQARDPARVRRTLALHCKALAGTGHHLLHLVARLPLLEATRAPLRRGSIPPRLLLPNAQSLLKEGGEGRRRSLRYPGESEISKSSFLKARMGHRMRGRGTRGLGLRAQVGSKLGCELTAVCSCRLPTSVDDASFYSVCPQHTRGDRRPPRYILPSIHVLSWHWASHYQVMFLLSYHSITVLFIHSFLSLLLLALLPIHYRYHLSGVPHRPLELFSFLSACALGYFACMRF